MAKIPINMPKAITCEATAQKLVGSFGSPNATIMAGMPIATLNIVLNFIFLLLVFVFVSV